jgi:anti-sigma B factor antagonist
LIVSGVGELREPPVRAVEPVAGAVVVHLRGELDLHNAPEVRDALTSLAESAPERIVVDLEDVEFIDSTTLGVLVESRRLLKHTVLVLAAPAPEPRRALEVSGLARYFDVYDTVAAARAAST